MDLPTHGQLHAAKAEFELCTQRRTREPHHRQQALDLRHQRGSLRRIAKALGAPLPSVGWVMKAFGLARLERVGHRITGDRRQGRSRGAGDETIPWRSLSCWLLRSSRRFRVKGRTPYRSRPQKNGIAGFPAIWICVMAAAARWLAMASAPSRATNACWSLNGLVRNHS